MWFEDLKNINDGKIIDSFPLSFNYFDKRNRPVPKKDMKSILELSPTASRTRTEVQLKIYEISDNLKSRN